VTTEERAEPGQAPADTAGRPGEPGHGSGSAEPSSEAPSAGDGERRTPMTQQVGRVAMVALAVLFGVFAVFNSQPVDFSWVFGETEVIKQGDRVLRGGVPLIILLLVSFALGLVVGRLSTWRRRRELRRQIETARDS
jgi:uncharacterized integral membrane protein